MNFDSDVVIGLEIHVELNTKSKLFCGCATAGSDTPNTRTCPVCLGHPGSKPVINEGAVDRILKLCKALECDVADALVFSRKSYFYPDMSKNFQITQFREPLGRGGTLRLSSDRQVGITRVHLEEDPAALVHPKGLAGSQYVLIDYNRAGNPLAEIVTQPQITSPKQAREFLNALMRILSYIGVFDSHAIIKADANVSIRESGYERVEIKNITGFKEIERALAHEVSRQRQVLRRGDSLVQETRSWDANRKTTAHMRTKETEDDYGYIFEPDLRVVEGMRARAKTINIPELPFQRAKRLVKEYELDAEDAHVMVSEQALADFFEELAERADPILSAQWLRRELLRVLNYADVPVSDSPITVDHLADVLSLLADKTISENTAQRLMELLIEEPFNVKEYVETEGLQQLSASDELKKYCQVAIENNPEAVKDFRSGKQKSLHYLVGQVMRATHGQAEPQKTRELLLKLLG